MKTNEYSIRMFYKSNISRYRFKNSDKVVLVYLEEINIIINKKRRGMCL